jgi:hypothetical protein
MSHDSPAARVDRLLPQIPIFSHGVPIGEKSLSFRSVTLLIASIVSWRLVNAFIGKKEQAKEEKTFGQSWEITQTPLIPSRKSIRGWLRNEETFGLDEVGLIFGAALRYLISTYLDNWASFLPSGAALGLLFAPAFSRKEKST